MDAALSKYIVRDNDRVLASNYPDVCIFCGTIHQISREHVIPKWVYENNPEKFFTTKINGINQTYNRTTVPVCVTCNSDLLSGLEGYITKLLLEVNLKTDFFTIEEIENIIRWLEVIDYKFQMLNLKRRFLKSAEGKYTPYLSDFPLLLLRPGKEYDSPSKVVTAIRRSQKKVTIRSKTPNVSSLVVFETSNKGFHFFHKMNDFIFLELPKHKTALFYFFDKTFANPKQAFRAASRIIDKVY